MREASEIDKNEVVMAESKSQKKQMESNNIPVVRDEREQERKKSQKIEQLQFIKDYNQMNQDQYLEDLDPENQHLIQKNQQDNRSVGSKNSKLSKKSKVSRNLSVKSVMSKSKEIQKPINDSNPRLGS